jgi:RNA polymerase sigma-70 factor (ECF subfamily)
VPPPAVPPFEPPEPTHRSEITWLQPYPDALLAELPDEQPGPDARYDSRESIELAFVAALQRLPPRQAAVLILRDVLGYDTVEAAEILATTPTAVKGALQRARATLEQTPARGAAPAPGSAEETQLGRRFAEAFVDRDIERLLDLLTDDAWLAMPPAPHEYHGRPAIAAFLRVSGAWRGDRRLILVPTRANRQPAFATYLTEVGGAVASAAGLMVLTVRGGGIAGLTRFFSDDVFVYCGLPRTTTVPEALAPSQRVRP